jgi:hypothetical protein
LRAVAVKPDLELRDVGEITHATPSLAFGHTARHRCLIEDEERGVAFAGAGDGEIVR